MEYNVSNADRLGEESRRAALFTFRVNFPKNPISMRTVSYTHLTLPTNSLV